MAYDNKGELIEYSKDELKKMASDAPKLPGLGTTYAATNDKLQAQQKIVVFLAKIKPPPTKKGPDEAGTELFQARPRVTAIVIAEEVAMPK